MKEKLVRKVLHRGIFCSLIVTGCIWLAIIRMWIHNDDFIVAAVASTVPFFGLLSVIYDLLT